MPALEGTFHAESWSAGVTQRDDGSVTLVGNSRAYLFDGRSIASFDMRRLTLKFTVDVHEVPCGTNAALYFIGSHDLQTLAPAEGYCDMQSTPSCVEIDIFEGNYAAVSLHARTCSTATCTISTRARACATPIPHTLMVHSIPGQRRCSF